MKIVFMGTPDFSVPALEALIAAGHDIVAVYTQPPRPAGRGKALRPSPVQRVAEQQGLTVCHPQSLRSAEVQAEFCAHDADIAVVVAYGLILPRGILEGPRQGCLNIHASLLPRWRGAAPINRAIMAGDKETGVCIMQMEAGLDTGPVVLRDSLPIGETETAGVLHDRLSAMGARLIVAALEHYDQLRPEPQATQGITYAAKIDKAEAVINWQRPAKEVARHINGLSPFPGAYIVRDGKRVKFLQARDVSLNGRPGEVLNGLTIACGDRAVEVLQVQPAGKGAMSAQDWLNGVGPLTGEWIGGSPCFQL